MPTDLTPAEKDDRQIERLIDKKPAPSRKPKGRGAPKHDNRRRRMKDHTEKEKIDKDLTRKTQAGRLLGIAARVAVTEEEEVHDPYVDASAEAKELIKQFYKELGKQSSDLAKAFEKFAVKEYGPIVNAKLGKPGKGKLDPTRVMMGKQEEVAARMRKLLGILHKVSRAAIKGTPADIAARIAELWPSGKPNNWATRAGVMAAVQAAIEDLKVPASVKAVMLKDPGNVKKNAALLEGVLRDSKDGKINEESLEDRVELATLTAAYRTLLKNPDTVDAASLVKDIDEVTERVYGEMQKLMAVPAFMKSWDKAVKELAKDDDPESLTASEYYDEVQKSLKTFFRDDEPVFDADTFVDGIETVLGDEFKKASPALKKVVDGYRSAATSYDALRGKAMSQRTATYHGVLQQGDPTHGPYKGYQSIDKRYFGKEHYDSIIAHAKELLKEDWLKFEWDAGAKDAPFRAALDMSIHLADGNLYQGKVDGETYNMLLARLMGDKVDVFSETLITNDDSTKSRRASAMSNVHYQNILRVASNLRKTDPRAALEIVKNLRSMVAQQQEQQEEEQEGKISQQEEEQEEEEQNKPAAQQQQSQECGPEMPGMVPPAPQMAPPAPPPPAGGGGPVQGQQQQQSQINDKDMDAFVEGKVDIKDLKQHLKQVVDAKSIEDFVDGMMEMDELLKKTASTRSARVAQEQQQQQQGQQEQTSALLDLEPLEDMDEEQQKAFLQKQDEAAKKLFAENDIEKFMEGLDAFFAEAEQAAKGVKTGSVVVAMSTLVRLAHAHPEARPVLLPIIVAAGKKKKKKEQRKKDKAKKKGKKGDKPNPFAKGGDKAKGKGGKKPPFGGKKAPPFGGKKAPPFGKKKSSVDIDPSDLKW